MIAASGVYLTKACILWLWECPCCISCYHFLLTLRFRFIIIRELDVV